jgi:manganese/zinc/iron transport system permease protein
MTLPIPSFSIERVIVAPWTSQLPQFGWIVLMGFFVGTACGLVGNYLILRRMALMGDAISHSVLPGLALAFLTTGSRGSWAMFLGALAAAVVTTVAIEMVHRNSRVKQDAAIGIVFSSLFALGVVLISVFADKVDLDQDCVLNGELALIALPSPVSIGSLTLGPPAVIRMGVVAILTVLLVLAFYKELLVSAFDSILASSLGIRSGVVHYGLMGWLSIVVVSAFESVGAILVVAMLIMPGATASLVSRRLPRVMGLTVLHAAISAVLGMHLGVWLDCSLAGAMVVAGAGLFVMAWLFNSYSGLLTVRWRHAEAAELREPTSEPETIRE